MALLLRKIRETRWYQAVQLPITALPADPLADLNTTKNDLSVWRVAHDKSNLENMVLALAAGQERLSNIDIALLDEADVQRAGLNVQSVAGRTPYVAARANHQNLVALTASNLIEIANAIRQTPDMKSFTEKEVGYLIANAVRDGRIDKAKLPRKLREDLEAKELI